MEKTIDITTDISNQQKWMTFFKAFTVLCIGFTVITILTIFFEEDLFRILTPFFAPFILLFIFLGYLVLVLSSIVYIPFQIKKVSWRAFLPVIINLTTFLVVYYLYDAIGNFRIDIGFRLNEWRYEQSANWAVRSLENGGLKLEEGKEITIPLPPLYKYLADRDQIYVTRENGNYRIFFSRGGGMFEYSPGYMYHSGNVNPPLTDGDIVCTRKIKPNWYDC